MNAWKLSLSVMLLVILLMGCSRPATETEPSSNGEAVKETQIEEKQQDNVKEIHYLGNTYSVPAELNTILFLNAFESLEDAVLLEYEPYAASAIGDEDEPFPGFFGAITEHTIPLLYESSDSLEYVLSLEPDLILSTDMETEANLEQLNKIAPTIPTSHFGANWQDNLELLAELTGKQEQAQQLITDYELSKASVTSLVPELQDKKVVAIRLRGGEMMVYPQDLFLNDVLYGEIGLTVPDFIASIDQQTVISLEGLTAIEPDYIYLQFDLYENNNNEQLLNELLESQIWKGLKAAQEGHVFVNAVDPLIMGGGTAYGRMSILHAVEETLR